MLLSLLTIYSQAQLNTYEFYDQEDKTGTQISGSLKYNNKIIIAGQGFGNLRYQAALMCVDSAGNMIWNTSTQDNTPSNNSFAGLKKVINGNDGFLYAYGWFSTTEAPQLWKVDAETGTIIWKKILSGVIPPGYLPDNILEYDAAKFIISYSAAYDGMNYTKRCSFISKANGNILSTINMGEYPWINDRYDVEIDADKNIYFSREDSLFKVSGADPSVFLWRKKYAASQISSTQKIYCDLNAEVYFIGRGVNSGHKVLKLSQLDGSHIATYTVNFGARILEDTKVLGNSLYFAWSHESTGGNSYTNVSKFDMVSGTVLWATHFNFPENYPSDEEAAQSIDLDAAGNVFATGYFASGYYGPGNWSILKLNGITGDVIYSKHITNGHAGYDRFSEGIAAIVINDVPCFAGNLQVASGSSKDRLTFVQLNNATGAVNIQKPIGAEGKHYASETIAIEPYNSNSTMVLKQVGRSLKVEMYDSLKHVLWTRDLTMDYYLLGEGISASPDGSIFCTASLRNESQAAPFYNVSVDSLMVFQLDPSGNLVKQYGVFLGTYVPNAKVTELYAGDISTLLFYQKDNQVYYRKISALTLSPEFSTQVTYENSGRGIKYCVDKDASTAYLFGKVSGTNRMIELDKNTLASTILAAVPSPIGRINSVESVDADHVVLSGKSVTEKEIVALYNTVTRDTVWTRQLSANQSQVVKSLIDPNGEFIYTIASGNNNIIVRKLAVAGGSEAWYYNYDGPAGAADFPADIAYDPFRNQVIVSGYETEGTNKRPVVLILDTAGVLLNTYSLPNESAGDASARCSHVLPDGSQWTGGGRSTLLSAGFIMESAGPIVPPCIPSPISINTFSMPSDADNCIGKISIDITGIPDFELNFDGGMNTSISYGYSLISNLCPGIHDLVITDGCTDTLTTQVVIPVDSNYVYNNPFVDSLAVDSLSTTSENCTIFYNSITTAYIDSVFATSNTVVVIWNIVDSSGPHSDTSTYVLNNGNGVYFLQLNVFCPTKAIGDYFTVTQAIYFEDGTVTFSTPLGLDEKDISFGLYPNPTDESVTIDFEGNSGELSIYDMQGKLIRKQGVQNGELILFKDAQAGMYLFELKTLNGVAVKRILKR